MLSHHLMAGITSVVNLTLTLSGTSGWLTWSPPLFSSEKTPLSCHIYIENQHGQLLYNDITEDTSYELYNLTVCDIYTATVIVHSGNYSSSNVTIQEECNEGNSTFTFLLQLICLFFIESNLFVLLDHEVIYNGHSFNVDIQITVS